MIHFFNLCFHYPELWLRQRRRFHSVCLQMKNRLSVDAAQGVGVVLGDLSLDKERLCLVTRCGGGMFFFFLRGRGLGELKYLEKDERVQCAPSSLCKHGERVENLWSCRTKDEVGGISVI